MNKKRNWFLLGGSIAIAALLFSAGAAGSAESAKNSVTVNYDELITTFNYETDPYFSEVLASWREQGIQNATQSIPIEAAEPALVSNTEEIKVGEYEGKLNVLLWNTSSTEWVEYKVDVAESALYEIEVSYHPLKDVGRKGPIGWEVTIDGKRPFREASSISLYRKWEDVRPILKNSDGDEIRPRSIDASGWSTEPLIDSGGHMRSLCNGISHKERIPFACKGLILWRWRKLCLLQAKRFQLTRRLQSRIPMCLRSMGRY